MNFELGMPHLNYNGIDPIWLSKTLVEIHWNFLKPLSSINIDNQRLYASVFAFEIDFEEGQDQFKEFDHSEIKSKIFKVNNQMYKSTHTITCTGNTANSSFETIFVKKDLTSGSLIKDIPISSDVKFDLSKTLFLSEHKELKKKFATIKNRESYNELVFSREAYFNGVKILYFANYLNLVYLSEYLTFNRILSPIKKINMFYFKNISPEDKVYGLTTNSDTLYETSIISDEGIMAYCKITR
jgi:probable biosynthetic protein (TIGR04098 family)